MSKIKARAIFEELIVLSRT